MLGLQQQLRSAVVADEQRQVGRHRVWRLKSDRLSEIRNTIQTMGTVSLRERRQITLPPDIVAAAGLQTNDTLEISLINGVIQLVPTHQARARARPMSRFLGAAGTVYGASADDVDAYVRSQRDSW